MGLTGVESLGSGNRSASVQKESYLRGGANSVRRQHYLECGQPSSPSPRRPMVLIPQS